MNSRTYSLECFYLLVICVLCFSVSAGIMWFFHDLLGLLPVIVAGIIGVGYGLNSVSKFIDRKGNIHE